MMEDLEAIRTNNISRLEALRSKGFQMDINPIFVRSRLDYLILTVDSTLFEADLFHEKALRSALDEIEPQVEQQLADMEKMRAQSVLLNGNNPQGIPPNPFMQ